MRGALYDLERMGIASNDTALTAFVHVGCRARLPQASGGSGGVGDRPDRLHMREAAPDLGRGDTSSLHLRIAAQVLRDAGPGRSPAGTAVAHRARYCL